jgi:hypothetical protein
MELEPMSVSEAEEFVASLRWQPVQGKPEGPLNKPPEDHEYHIVAWGEADGREFGRFRMLIQERGYRGRYVAPYNGRTMYNDYLVVGSHVYWFIGMQSLNRTPADMIQHEPLPDQASLLD